MLISSIHYANTLLNADSSLPQCINIKTIKIFTTFWTMWMLSFFAALSQMFLNRMKSYQNGMLAYLELYLSNCLASLSNWELSVLRCRKHLCRNRASTANHINSPAEIDARVWEEERSHASGMDKELKVMKSEMPLLDYIEVGGSEETGCFAKSCC